MVGTAWKRHVLVSTGLKDQTPRGVVEAVSVRQEAALPSSPSLPTYLHVPCSSEFPEGAEHEEPSWWHGKRRW